MNLYLALLAAGTAALSSLGPRSRRDWRPPYEADPADTDTAGATFTLPAPVRDPAPRPADRAVWPELEDKFEASERNAELDTIAWAAEKRARKAARKAALRQKGAA